eukprot:TRINITY_DN8133_c0_g1_i13.p1 TRINITY_DN8133_c0_g1~~TRINITY_DN8133_c0_g1_i13.p1  ORF type:complete len:145 (+),score=35.42 TRINITY_DN8133_c0_g1_i13:194-628(+)
MQNPSVVQIKEAKAKSKDAILKEAEPPKENPSLNLRESLKRLSKGRHLEAIEERESEYTREDKCSEPERYQSRYAFEGTDPKKLGQRQASAEARKEFRKEVKAKVDSFKMSKSNRGLSKDYLHEVDNKINTMLMKDGTVGCIIF